MTSIQLPIWDDQKGKGKGKVKKNVQISPEARYHGQKRRIIEETDASQNSTDSNSQGSHCMPKKRLNLWIRYSSDNKEAEIKEGKNNVEGLESTPTQVKSRSRSNQRNIANANVEKDNEVVITTKVNKPPGKSIDTSADQDTQERSDLDSEERRNCDSPTLKDTEDLSEKHDGVDLDVSIDPSNDFVGSDSDPGQVSSSSHTPSEASGVSDSSSKEEYERRRKKIKKLRKDPEVQKWMDSMVAQRVGRRESRSRSRDNERKSRKREKEYRKHHRTRDHSRSRSSTLNQG